ncbi:MAG: hypothetical protein ACM3KR_11400 [Deltaproteobacteria bacterium]
MKKDKYSLFDHFYYCTLALVVVLIIIFMQCLNNTNSSITNLETPNAAFKIHP